MAAPSAIAAGFWSPVRLWVVTDPDVPERVVLEAARSLDDSLGASVGFWFRDKRPNPDVSLGRRLRDSLHHARFLAGSRALADALDVSHVHEPTHLFSPNDAATSAPAHSLEEAQAAVTAGAQTLMLSPIFKTKHANAPAGVGLLSRVRDACPGTLLYALGGITTENAASCVRAGAQGVAVQGALWQSPSPRDTAKAIVDALRDVSG